MHFADGISKWTPAPVLTTMNLATIAFDEAAIFFDHRGHLLALIWMHEEHDFVVSHEYSPFGLEPPNISR